MHRPFRSLFLAIALTSGAGLLVPPDPAVADPPDWAEASFREADTWHPPVTRQSVFGGGVCIGRPNDAQAGALPGQGLASQVTGGNAASPALGGVLGAVPGSQFGGHANAADEDCTYQILEGAADRERTAWEDTASATQYTRPQPTAAGWPAGSS